jgi:hypothetical protein
MISSVEITGISYSPSVCVRKTRSGNIILAIKPHEKRFVKGSDCHEMAGLELVVFRELIQPYDGHGLLRCLLTGRGAVTRSDIVLLLF